MSKSRKTGSKKWIDPKPLPRSHRWHEPTLDDALRDLADEANDDVSKGDADDAPDQ